MAKEFKPTEEELKQYMDQVDRFVGGMDNISKKLDELDKPLSELTKMMARVTVATKVAGILSTIAEARSIPDGFAKKGLTPVRTLDNSFYIMKDNNVLMSRDNKIGEILIGDRTGYHMQGILNSKGNGIAAFRFSSGTALDKPYSETFPGNKFTQVMEQCMKLLPVAQTGTEKLFEQMAKTKLFERR